MATAIERATVCMWAEEPNYRAPLRATGPGTLPAHAALDDNGERFTATAAGSTTTTVCAALTEATAAGYCGCLLRCIAATAAANVGIVVLVRASDGAGTLTHTAFPEATESGDQFELADVDARVVETTGGSSAQVDSTMRINAAVETDDFWAGYHLVAENADNTLQGTPISVTAFTAASGRFTAALSGASVVGDLWHLRKFPKLVGQPTITFSQEDLERPAARGELGEEQTVPGPRSWSSEWVLALKGSGTAAGAGVAGVPPPEANPVMRSVFAIKQSTGTAVVAQSGTSPPNSATVFNVATGGAANFPVGSVIHDNAGRTSVVTQVAANGADPDSITHRPGFGRTPIVGEIIRGGCSYEPQMSGHKTMTLDAFIGGKLRWMGFGGLPTVRVTDLARGRLPKLAFGFRGGYWVSYAQDKPTTLVAQQDSVIPRSAADCIAQIVPEGSSTPIRLIVDEGEIDFGMELAEEPAVDLWDGQYGGRIINTVPRITMQCWLDMAAPNASHDEFLRYLASQVFSLHWQHGAEPGKTVTFYAHRCAYAFPGFTTQNGLHRMALNVRVLPSELTSMPICTLGWT